MSYSKWTPECDAVLRYSRELGLSFAQARDQINQICHTNYSRNAVICRAKRLAVRGSQREIATRRAAAAVRREEYKRLQLKDSRFVQHGKAAQNVGR